MCRVDQYGELTPCEATFVTALLDQMLRVGAASAHRTDIHEAIYFDSAIAADWLGGEGACIERPEWAVGADPGTQWGGSWAALRRVGMAAAHLYCVKVCGKSFAESSAIEKEEVLSVLDRIKLVFADGSSAALFLAAVGSPGRSLRHTV